MDAYELRLKQRDEAVSKYKKLPLYEFIQAVFMECGYDLNRLDNVYIGELVQMPNVWGCLKKGETYITYFTNERAQIAYQSYDDASKFMDVFVSNSMIYNKYNGEQKKTK